MLTSEDWPTIRNAIVRRLDTEPGVAIADIAKEPLDDGLRVHVWLLRLDTVQTEGLIDTRSSFDLPKEFDHAHLINEIDQIAEHSKEAKRKAGPFMVLRPRTGREQLTGTGLRGLWTQ